MLMHVRFEVFDTITDPDAVARIRQGFAEQVRKVLLSGKVRASGIFTDARAGFFLMDVDSAENLFDLLTPAMLDGFRIDTHPVMAFDELVEFFRKTPPL
jgi:muconolactone delta-isomerase